MIDSDERWLAGLFRSIYFGFYMQFKARTASIEKREERREREREICYIIIEAYDDIDNSA